MTEPPDSTLHKPTRRHYEERERRRDADAAEQINRLRAGLWSVAILFFAVPLGLTVGGFPWGLLGGFLAAAAVYAGTMALARGGAAAFGMVHNPAGDVAPAKRDYSYAQSLAKRGDYPEALCEYERAVGSFPEDPEPYLRIARIHRDDLRSPEEALRWFKRARAETPMGPGLERLVTHEIIELHRDHLASPRRAIPELARFIDRFPNDPGVAEAREELARLRERLSD